MVNLLFLSCCLLVDHVVFEERYVRSFDGMEASFHELKLVDIFSVVFLVVVCRLSYIRLHIIMDYTLLC